MEIMSAARVGSNLYARLSRSPQSPLGCRRAGRSACAPATHRCTPGGSGARRQSISLGSLHKSTAAFTASMRNCMSRDILLKPRLVKATHGRIQHVMQLEGKLHEETDLYCSPPSRLSRSPHSQKPMKQLHSRTMYQHHGLHFRLQEAAVYPHKAAQHEVLQSRTGRAICNTACKSLHALSTFTSFTTPFSGLNLLAVRRISSCKAAWVGAGAEGLTHPKDFGWDQACQTAGRSSGREERERSAQTLRTLPAAPPPPLLARTT